MADEQREIPQESYVPLGPEISLTDVSIHPTKKEPKTTNPFGIRISTTPRESLDETVKPLADVPLCMVTTTSSRTSMTQEPRMNLLEQRLFGFHSEEMSLFSASGTKLDQNLKTHCSFHADSSENVNLDISLAFKATSMPLTDVYMSPTKKNEPKIIHLFGKRIPVLPQESSSLSSKAASMPLTEVAISPTKKRSRASMIKEMSHCLFNAKYSENPREKLKEDARKIKKMRYLSTELDLNTPPCTIRKTLTASDIGHLSRLMLQTCQAESHILSHFSEDEQRTIQEGNGVNFKLYDHDTNTEYELVLKRMVKTTRSYVFQGRWVKDFVDRRRLKQGHEIGLFWNYVDSRLHFCVLSRAPADHNNLI